MRRISINNIKPGMRVARPVYNSDGQVLLNQGTEITKRYINRLQQLNIMSVYIDDGLNYELAVDDVITDQTRLRAIKNIKKILNRECEHNIGNNIIVPEEVFNTIDDIMDELLSTHNIMVNLTDIRSADDYVFGHSVNVCVLALITGIALGYERSKLKQLAVGAMLHDIGKIMVPKEILNKPGKLTNGEFEIIQKHSQWGYEILRSYNNISITSCVAAYQHHERYNGEGYPQGLSQNQIHEFAQIVGLVDMYDAITADRVYRKAFPPNEAYEMVAATGDYLFRFDIVQAFLKHVAAFPLGTLVELNSGERGVVVQTAMGMALRPKIRLLTSSTGEDISNEDLYINLAQKTTVVINRVLEGNEIPMSKHN